MLGGPYELPRLWPFLKPKTLLNFSPFGRFHYAARIWDGVKKSSALAEYSRLLA